MSGHYIVTHCSLSLALYFRVWTKKSFSLKTTCRFVFFVFLTVNIHFVESLFSNFHRPPSTPLEPQLEIPWSLLKLYQGTGWCNRISNILRNSPELKSRNLPLKAVSMSQSSLKNRAVQGGWCFSRISSSQWNIEMLL